VCPICNPVLVLAPVSDRGQDLIFLVQVPVFSLRYFSYSLNRCRSGWFSLVVFLLHLVARPASLFHVNPVQHRSGAQ
jgi:hypothetical protein